MRFVILLPLALAVVAAGGCRTASEGTEQAALGVPQRDLTLQQAAAPEVEISALAYSSNSVTPGALFFCVPGFRSDGHDFAPAAVERGAVALVCQRPLGLGVPEVLVTQGSRGALLLCAGRRDVVPVRRNSPPIRTACAAVVQLKVSPTVHVRCWRLLKLSFGPPNEKRSIVPPGRPM